ANCLLAIADKCLRSCDLVNVVVAGKQPGPTWLPIEQAVLHCDRGLGIWEWASNDEGRDPDVVLACAGDIPTLETLAAADVIDQLPHLGGQAARVRQFMVDKRAEARAWTRASGEDIPEVVEWVWPG